jgi:hypothetical protein
MRFRLEVSMRGTRIPPLPLRRYPPFNFFWVFAMAACSTISCGSDGSVSTVETGAIEVNSSTTGSLLDPDGYAVSLDAASGQTIGINASLTLSDIVPGQHTVELSGIAPNCTVTGPNPGAITVVANATAQSSFTVTCVSGSIEIITATSGTPLDPDGYTVSLDATPGQPVGINASLMLSDVAPGQHTVELSGLASNCTVTGSNPEVVTVVANATAQSSFAVTCESGSIEIITATSGTALDPDGYDVSLDGAPQQPIDINASLTLTDVTPGQHTVELSGLASNCGVTGANPETVRVVANTTAQVSLDVACGSPGKIRVTVATTGTNIPGLFIAFVSAPTLYFFEVDPNGSTTSGPLSVGSHTVDLGVGPNCSVTGSRTRTVTVQSGLTTDVNFTVACS